jgi:hypothetical protein
MDIFDAIRQEYGQQTFPCWLLCDILRNCGYSQREISAIIREAINQKQIGIVSFKKLKRRPPPKSLIVIK